MPRDLGDVLHYFVPEAGAPSARKGPAAEEPETRPQAKAVRAIGDVDADAGPARAALPILALPIGDRDVVRGALAWNLGVEIARLGGQSVLVAPDGDEGSPLWPDTGPGPLGARVEVSGARDLVSLHRAALEYAVAARGHQDGLVIVRVPPDWLCPASGGEALLSWTLLLTSAASRDLVECYGLAKRVRAARPTARIGVTFHGIRRLVEAERAFARLADGARQHLRCSLRSYGALLGELDVYRAIVARRPIGHEHPQSIAARSLQDVGALLFADVREGQDG